MTSDETYMKEALELAAKGLGRTSPNPAVGCVIVKGGKVVGRGWHKKAGDPHAEIEALKKAGGKAKGATVYVTLEPCCCYGRTPPCTKALIAAGVKKVVTAMKDPNPKVSGNGLAELKGAGIGIKSGVLEKEAMELNEFFTKHITTGLPFVIAKAALSADGKLAASDGSSRWITGEEARAEVHKLRNVVDAVMVGAGTVIKDDPLLTCRLPGGRNPKRIIVDAKLAIPLNSRVLGKDVETIIATSVKAPNGKANALEEKGAKIIYVKESEGKLDVVELMKTLGKMNVMSVMIEGGGRLLGSAFDTGIVDKIIFFIAPKIIGDGVSIRAESIKSINEALVIRNFEMKQVGDDFMLSGYMKKI